MLHDKRCWKYYTNMRLSWCELIICPNCPSVCLSRVRHDTRHGRDNLMGLGSTLNWTHLSRKLDPTSERWELPASPRLIHLAKWVTGVWSVSGVNSSYSNSQNRQQTYYRGWFLNRAFVISMIFAPCHMLTEQCFNFLNTPLWKSTKKNQSIINEQPQTTSPGCLKIMGRIQNRSVFRVLIKSPFVVLL